MGEMRDGMSIRSRIYADHAKLFQQLGVLSLGKKVGRRIGEPTLDSHMGFHYNIPMIRIWILS